MVPPPFDHHCTCATSLQACVPADALLIVTLQRASNLPRRMAAIGGGARTQSPARTGRGAHFCVLPVLLASASDVNSISYACP